MCKIFDDFKIYPIPLHTQTHYCVFESLKTVIENSVYNQVNNLRIIGAYGSSDFDSILQIHSNITKD